MIDKRQSHKVVIPKNFDNAKWKKRDMKSKAEEQLKRESNMWSSWKIGYDEVL
jgi:hypothetical protein